MPGRRVDDRAVPVRRRQHVQQERPQDTAVGWAIAPDQSVNYVRHDHAAQGPLSGLLAKYGPIKPLENFSSDAWGQ